MSEQAEYHDIYPVTKFEAETIKKTRVAFQRQKNLASWITNPYSCIPVLKSISILNGDASLSSFNCIIDPADGF